MLLDTFLKFVKIFAKTLSVYILITILYIWVKSTKWKWADIVNILSLSSLISPSIIIISLNSSWLNEGVHSQNKCLNHHYLIRSLLKYYQYIYISVHACWLAKFILYLYIVILLLGKTDSETVAWLFMVCA